MASGSIYDEDGENDDNLGPNREEEEETLADGVTRSQQNLCLNSGDEFKMQAGEDVVPLNSPEQEAEQMCPGSTRRSLDSTAGPCHQIQRRVCLG